MVQKLPLLIAVAAALSFGVVVCGDDEDSDSSSSAGSTPTESTPESTTPSGGDGETVAVTETEYKIDPADPTVKAGTVTFSITNDGEQPHDVEIEGNGVEEVSDTINPGSSGELTVDLEAGTYEMYCTIDGHKDLGMDGSVTVQ